MSEPSIIFNEGTMPGGKRLEDFVPTCKMCKNKMHITDVALTRESSYSNQTIDVAPIWRCHCGYFVHGKCYDSIMSLNDANRLKVSDSGFVKRANASDYDAFAQLKDKVASLTQDLQNCYRDFKTMEHAVDILIEENKKYSGDLGHIKKRVESFKMEI